MLALLRNITRLAGGQNFQQAPLLAKFFPDLRQGLQDPRQIRTRAATALCLGVGDRSCEVASCIEEVHPRGLFVIRTIEKTIIIDRRHQSNSMSLLGFVLRNLHETIGRLLLKLR
jgi:hypothetical protein